MRAVAKQKKIKIGTITWNKIESSYDLQHWVNGGGKDNKINDVTLDAEVEANVSETDFERLKQLTENLCPIYQTVIAGGVKVTCNWKLKKID